MGPDPVGPDSDVLSFPGARQRSVKRKLYGMGDDNEGQGGRGSPPLLVAARVGAADEVEALREALVAQESAAAGLCAELEEERAASASAASEAISVILRLQREKGEAQMVARQYQRFVEEKMAQDQRELLALGDLLYEREQQIQALSREVEACRHRLLSHGIAAETLEPAADTDSAALEGRGDNEEYDSVMNQEYPQWRCSDDPDGVDTDIDGGEDDAYLEMEKGVVMGQSPQRQLSMDSFGSLQHGELDSLDCRGDDDDTTSDRVYTVDAVHSGAELITGVECYVGTAREEVCRVDGPCGEEETDMKKLEMRLQVLEADRESMRQAILSMQGGRSKLVLLKEISQHLCRGASPCCAPLVERKLVKKPCFLWWCSFLSMVKVFLETSFIGSFSFMSTIKWIISFIFWKKKTDRSKYMFSLSNNNVGLLLLLDNAPRIRQLRCHSRTRDLPV